jgi:serine phosphatase RsbU (regulator of sigma subunit)
METATLARGDVLVFYTDGVTEARRGKTLFEVDRLTRVVEKSVAARRSAQEIAAAIYDAVAAYAAPGNLADDIALLVLKAR